MMIVKLVNTEELNVSARHQPNDPSLDLELFLAALHCFARHERRFILR